jgi:hypothetical protein
MVVSRLEKTSPGTVEHRIEAAALEAILKALAHYEMEAGNGKGDG